MTLKHLRSSTANKRPTASGLADGQLGINTASGTPGIYIKDSASGIVKVGPAHVGTTAPNATPAGSAGNSRGELWIDESTTIIGAKYFNGTSFVNLTPSGTLTAAGLLELATGAETQTGTDAVRAVSPSGLQSKLSDSVATTSSTTIASSTAVKTAYDLANAALPRTGGIITGNLEIGSTGSLTFEGSVADSFETTLAVTNPTADRTITLPDRTGTVITTADVDTVTGTMIASGTVTSTNILDGTIVNADINASAAIADTKLATISTANKVSIAALDIDGATDIGAAIVDADLIIVDDGAAGTNRKAAASRLKPFVYAGVSGDITLTSSGVATIGNGVIIDAEVNASAAIAGTKISPNFGSQDIRTSGNIGAGAAPVYDIDANTTGAATILRVRQGDLSATNTFRPTVLLDKGSDNVFALSCDGGAAGSGVTYYEAKHATGQHIFYSNGKEQMRIVASGDGHVLIGRSTATSGTGKSRLAIDVVNNTENISKMAVLGYGASLGYGIIFQPANDSTPTACLFTNNAGTTVGAITTSVSATTYATSSDYRVKENVQPIVGAVEKVMALKPCSFTFVQEAGVRRNGFLAHEFQEVVPYGVTGTKDAVDEDGQPVLQGIDHSTAVPLLTAALQEALQRISALEAQLS